MKKKIDTTIMENELQSGSAFFRQPVEPTVNPAKEPSPLPSSSPASTDNPSVFSGIPSSPIENPSLPHPADRSDDQSASRFIDQSTHQLMGPILTKPVGFYLPEIINRQIDEAVYYYRTKRGMKVDRSLVISALLGDPQIWTPEYLDQLANKVMAQLINRSTNR